MGYHKPVLLHKSVDGLAVKSGGTYVDLTFGGGGHSVEILRRMGKGLLVAFDQDADSMYEAEKIKDKRFLFIRGNFRFFRNYLRFHNILKVDGILADLGVSSHHFDSAERGFSFSYPGPLDMRMNREASLKASDIVNTYSEEELSSVFRNYGEVSNFRKLAKTIVEARGKEAFESTGEFVNVVSSSVPPGNRNKYLAKVFQALRIEVNREADSLREMLEQVLPALKKEGRLSVISYHSIEDRMVKNFTKTGNVEGKLEKDFYGKPLVPLRPLNRKAIVAGEKEVSENNRSRSARLRIAEKI